MWFRSINTVSGYVFSALLTMYAVKGKKGGGVSVNKLNVQGLVNRHRIKLLAAVVSLANATIFFAQEVAKGNRIVMRGETPLLYR